MKHKNGGIDIAIVGGGPAGLFVAERIATGLVGDGHRHFGSSPTDLSPEGPAGSGIGLQGASTDLRHRIVVFDRMPTPGRKFLLAGRGGLNLTHSEAIDEFNEKYGNEADVIKRAVAQFPPSELRKWADGLGAKTFVGTSGRVFPEVLRSTPLLRAWLRRLHALGVEFETNMQWIGFEDAETFSFRRTRDKSVEASVDALNETILVRASVCVFALGGASWPRLGADGSWAKEFRRLGVATTQLEAANCGFHVNWSEHVRRFGGQPLKNIALSCQGQTVKGEVLLDPRGIEGNAIYAIGKQIRAALAEGRGQVRIDLRADLPLRTLISKLETGPGKQSSSSWLRKAGGLSAPAIAVLRETIDVDAIRNQPEMLATAIKSVPIEVVSTYPIERAISTAGGIRLDEITDRFELKRRRNCYVVGEMLDWEAPTGGYLLQGCFSSAAVVADAILEKLQTSINK